MIYEMQFSTRFRAFFLQVYANKKTFELRNDPLAAVDEENQ
jgi:hypothetical protein